MNSQQAPEPFYIVYIDEAGDPGLAKVRPRDPDGATEWMVLGAVVVRARVEPQVVDWVRAIRSDIRDTQGADLHFRTLSDHRRQRVARLVSGLPVRAFVVASHKLNMRGHRNLAAEAVNVSPSARGWYYNFCIRLLLERVTRICADRSKRECGKPQLIKFVFAERGGVKYNWLRVYFKVLIKQASEGTTVLTKRIVRHETLDTRLIEVIAARNSAGCQLADVVTSAFYTAVNTAGSRWATGPAEILKPRMAEESDIYQDCGVSLQPSPPWKAAKWLTDVRQQEIFKFYGFDFR